MKTLFQQSVKSITEFVEIKFKSLLQNVVDSTSRSIIPKWQEILSPHAFFTIAQLLNSLLTSTPYSLTSNRIKGKSEICKLGICHLSL